MNEEELREKHQDLLLEGRMLLNTESPTTFPNLEFNSNKDSWIFLYMISYTSGYYFYLSYFWPVYVQQVFKKWDKIDI